MCKNIHIELSSLWLVHVHNYLIYTFIVVCTVTSLTFLCRCNHSFSLYGFYFYVMIISDYCTYIYYALQCLLTICMHLLVYSLTFCFKLIKFLKSHAWSALEKVFKLPALSREAKRDHFVKCISVCPLTKFLYSYITIKASQVTCSSNTPFVFYLPKCTLIVDLKKSYKNRV